MQFTVSCKRDEGGTIKKSVEVEISEVGVTLEAALKALTMSSSLTVRVQTYMRKHWDTLGPKLIVTIDGRVSDPDAFKTKLRKMLLDPAVKAMYEEMIESGELEE